MKEFILDLIDRVQATFPPNRIVVLLTPVIAAASGWLAVWSAEHVAFLNLTQGELAAIFIAGVGVVVPTIYKWLDGWQAHERRKATGPYFGRDLVNPQRQIGVPVEVTRSSGLSVSPSPTTTKTPEDVTDEAREAARRRLGYPPQED